MRVVIVGGGLLGTALAARLGDGEGFEVTLCTHSSLTAGPGNGSTGVFAWGTPSPTRFDGRLRERAWSLYEELVDESGLEVNRIGSLHVAETDRYATRLEEAASTLTEYGVEASYVVGDELGSFGLSSDRFTGGLYSPADCAFDEATLLETVASRARERGVDIRTGLEVIDVRTVAGEVTGVETDHGILEADVVVNAAELRALEVNRLAGVDLPLSQVSSPVVVLEGVSTTDLPFTVLESRRSLRPVGKARVYFGKCLADYAEGMRYDPTDLRIPEGFRRAASAIGDVIPGLGTPATVDEWVDRRTVTPDGLPLVGETDVAGFYVACRSADLGVTLTPVVAEVLAKTLEGTVERDVRVRLSPDRFS